MKRRLTPILILVIFSALLIAALIFIYLSRPEPFNPAARLESEKGGPASVSIDNTERLSEILLYNQFVSVKDALASYILSETKGEASTAEILIGTTVLKDDGAVQFKVKADGMNKEFEVVIQRVNVSELTFMVPEKNYRITLYPYGQ